jgi:D-cysteine desulfhydrase
VIEPELHRRYPQLRATLPHLSLGSAPTPVRPAPALSAEGGAAVWVKDESGFGDGGWGGNKVRKLEWLLPEAVRRGRTDLVTVGGLGTNWGLAAALYGRELGLRTTLVLVDQPVDDHVTAQLVRLRKSGARLHIVHGKAAASLMVASALARRPRRSVFLPLGGSSPVGVLGYVETALELAAQVQAGVLDEPSHLVTPIGSGGTAAGLALGLRLAGLRTRVVGVLVNNQTKVDAAALAHRTAKLLAQRGAGEIAQSGPDVEVVHDWIGAGYGHPLPQGAQATAVAARDGLALEAVYTAKAVAGLLAMNAAGRFGPGPVVYLHTYGPRSDV